MPERGAPLTVVSAPPAIVRAVASVDELRQAFALRYEVYSREGWIARTYDSAATRLELDACDRTSIHLGLFSPAAGGRLIGYVRLITRKPQIPGMAMADAIVAASGDAPLRHAYGARYREGLPVFASFPLEALRRTLAEQRLRCAELSRLVVRADVRQCGLGARLVRRTLAVAAANRVDVVFVGCGLPRVGMFQRLGFDLLDTPILNYQRIEQPSRALWQRVGDSLRAGGTS